MLRRSKAPRRVDLLLQSPEPEPPQPVPILGLGKRGLYTHILRLRGAF
jgi:hypothetical protein